MPYIKPNQKHFVKEGPFAGLWVRTARALEQAGYTDKSQLKGVLFDESFLLRNRSPSLKDFGKLANEELVAWLMAHERALAKAALGGPSVSGSGIKIVSIHPAKVGVPIPRPLMLSRTPAGFPSPAEDHIDRDLDLNEHLIRRKASTFFVRVAGTSMIGAGINNGALLIVDRSEEARDGRIVVAVIDGAHTVKRMRCKGDRCWLEAANPAYPDIQVLDDESRVWGVVTFAINPL